MLDIYVKDSSVEDTTKALAVAKTYGIKTAMSIIVGNPEEHSLTNMQPIEWLSDANQRSYKPAFLTAYILDWVACNINDTTSLSGNWCPRTLVIVAGVVKMTGVWQRHRTRRDSSNRCDSPLLVGAITPFK